MDNEAIIDHLDECVWKIKNITKTIRWFTYMGLKRCPSCEKEVNNG